MHEDANYLNRRNVKRAIQNILCRLRLINTKCVGIRSHTGILVLSLKKGIDASLEQTSEPLGLLFTIQSVCILIKHQMTHETDPGQGSLDVLKVVLDRLGHSDSMSSINN